MYICRVMRNLNSMHYIALHIIFSRNKSVFTDHKDKKLFLSIIKTKRFKFLCCSA